MCLVIIASVAEDSKDGLQGSLLWAPLMVAGLSPPTCWLLSLLHFLPGLRDRELLQVLCKEKGFFSVFPETAPNIAHRLNGPHPCLRIVIPNQSPEPVDECGSGQVRHCG